MMDANDRVWRYLALKDEREQNEQKRLKELLKKRNAEIKKLKAEILALKQGKSRIVGGVK